MERGQGPANAHRYHADELNTVLIICFDKLRTESLVYYDIAFSSMPCIVMLNGYCSQSYRMTFVRGANYGHVRNYASSIEN